MSKNNEQKAKERIAIAATKAATKVVGKTKKYTRKTMLGSLLGLDFVNNNIDFLYGVSAFACFPTAIYFFLKGDMTSGIGFIVGCIVLIFIKKRAELGELTKYFERKDSNFGKLGNKSNAQFLIFAMSGTALYFLQKGDYFGFLVAVFSTGLISTFKSHLPESWMDKLAKKTKEELKIDFQKNTIYGSHKKDE